ncbi:MAG: hypothetical protein HC835_18300 [Oscillatoriales cyanobacterium RM2_1_1]|nr:hypothetical protein [Oscillatoriales cyanobacterium RM2_1_1]
MFAIVSLMALASRGVSQSDVGSSVFYPDNLPDNCEVINSQLEAGQYPLIHPTDTERIGLKLQWQLPGRSPNLSSALHSLRFLACLIGAGEQGDGKALKTAETVLLDWAKTNPLEGSPQDWTAANNLGPWEPETVAWRAVVLSYFYRVYRVELPDQSPDPAVLGQLVALAQTHGDLLTRTLIYYADNHRGLTNSLGLLALGSAFKDLPESSRWLEVGLGQAEQQMQENVSIDGIHLEQSGEIHHLALQQLMEIYRVAQRINLPLSEAYRQRLDRMLGASALMIGSNRRVEGLPDSDPQQEMTSTLLKTFNNLDLGFNSPGQGLLAKTRRREITRGLHLYRQGGYSFFVPGSSKELEAVFKTHILNSPNFHQDALMVTARTGDRELLIYPSKYFPGKIDPYFNTAMAANTVQVGDLQQIPLLPLPNSHSGSGLISSNLENLLNRWVWLNPFSKQQPKLPPEVIPLKDRVLPQNGQVIAFSSSPELDFVAAQQQTYPGIRHTRTVARIGADFLLVWDQLQSPEVQSYSQTFHFPPELRVKLMGSEGVLRSGQDPVARFIQLAPQVPGRVCRGRLQPRPCGWYTDSSTARKQPTSAVLYETQAQDQRFLWILSTGGQTIKARLDTVQEGVESYQLVTLSKGDRQMRLALKGATVQLEK